MLQKTEGKTYQKQQTTSSNKSGKKTRHAAFMS